MLRAEERGERKAGVGGVRISRQHIDGATAITIQPHRAGEQPHAQMATMFLCERLKSKKLLRLEDVDTGHHVAITCLPVARTRQRFVVAGKLRELAVLLRPDADSLRD